MVSVTATPIKGMVLRIVQLDLCGAFSGSGVSITNAFTQVQMSPQYQNGEEFYERTSDGTTAVNISGTTLLKRMQLQLDLMIIDPDMVPLVITARELVTVAPVGYGFGLSEGPATPHFSLEVWQRIAGAAGCIGGVPQYIYNAWPHCRNAQVGTYVISNARSALQFTCETLAPNPAWGTGPSGSSYLPVGTVVGPLEHWLWNITSVAPPPSGDVPLLDGGVSSGSFDTSVDGGVTGSVFAGDTIDGGMS